MRRMRKKISLLLVLVLLLAMGLLVGCGGAAAEDSSSDAESSEAAETSTESTALQAIKEKGVLVVGSSNDAPFAYIDAVSNEFKGVDAEVIVEVAKRLGIEKVEMKNIPFSELITNLNMGNIDIISDCMYVRPQRQELAYFGDHWYKQGEALVVAADSTIKSKASFTGEEVIGFTEGTVFQGLVEGWEEEGLIKEALSVGDQPQLLLAVQTGKIDGCITDSTVIEYYMQLGDEQVAGLKLAEEYEPEPENIGFISPAVTFENKTFVHEINDVMDELRAEGFVDEVMTHYGLDPELHKVTTEESRVQGNKED